MQYPSHDLERKYHIPRNSIIENTIWFMTRKKTAAMVQTSSHQTLVFNLRRENIRRTTATSADTTTTCAADFNSAVLPNIDFEKKFGIPCTPLDVTFDDTQKAALEKSFAAMISLLPSVPSFLSHSLSSVFPSCLFVCYAYYHAGSPLLSHFPQCTFSGRRSPVAFSL